MKKNKSSTRVLLAQESGSNTLGDIELLRLEYKKVDTKDPAALYKWFTKYKYLKTWDFVTIMQCREARVYELRKLAGITGRGGKPPIYIAPSKAKTIPLPENWRTKEWLSTAIQDYSQVVLAKSAGCSRITFQKILKEFGIVTKKEYRKSKNKFYNHDWCFYQYVTLNQTLEACAKKAGITRKTFSCWLSHFSIAQRTKREKQLGRAETAVWVHRFLQNLKDLRGTGREIVRYIKHRKNHIHLRFMSYFWETYYFKAEDAYGSNGDLIPYSYPVTETSSMISDIPEIIYEFEGDLAGGNPYPAHIMVTNNKPHTFLERRLALHDFVRRINQSYDIWPYYPDKELEADKQKLYDYTPQDYQRRDGRFKTYKDHGDFASVKLLTHFFGLEEYRLPLKSPRVTTRLCNSVTENGHILNTTNLINALIYTPYTYRAPKLRYRDPRAYAVLLQRLGIKGGSVLDPFPGLGYKAIACALLGLKYYTVPNAQFDIAIKNGFDKFLGLDHSYYDGDQVDLLWYDDNHGIPDLSLMRPYLPKAKRMIAYIPTHMRFQIESKYKPQLMMNIDHTRYVKPAYYALW